MQQGQAPDPWTAFALQTFAVNGLILAAGEGIARPLGQSSARWQVLGRVHAPRTVPDLAREIGLTRQSVQRVADALAVDGLVAFLPHPQDRRTQLVELTASGREVVTALYQRQLAWSEQLMMRLDPQVLHLATEALADVATALQEAVVSPVSGSPRQGSRT